MNEALTQVPVDVVVLMEQIRARIKTAAEEKGAPSSQFVPRLPSGGTVKVGTLRFSEELRRLNEYYAELSQRARYQVVTHRRGPLGALVVKLKEKCFSFLEPMVKYHLEGELAFKAKLLQFLNDIGPYVDDRDASNFWELIAKIDVDTTNCTQHVDRVVDDVHSRLDTLTSNTRRDIDIALRSIERSYTEQKSKVEKLDEVVSGLEAILSHPLVQPPLTGESSSDKAFYQTNRSGSPIDFSYLLLENRFRGSEEHIRDRVKPYVEMYKSTTLPVCEIGSGRGELLSLLVASGVPAYGVDLDPGMVSLGESRNLPLTYGDGIQHLNECAAHSLGGVVAIQVVEHLSVEARHELYRNARHALCPGGKLVLETINPQSIVALSSNYFRDPTHVAPLHPDTLRFELELAGFLVKKVEFLSPFPKEALLREIEGSKIPLPPSLLHVIEIINHNVRVLNERLFGFQDFCVVAEARVNEACHHGHKTDGQRAVSQNPSSIGSVDSRRPLA
jgi:SAM-dependent methyltransferase